MARREKGLSRLGSVLPVMSTCKGEPTCTIKHFRLPRTRLKQVHVDLFGPLPISQGHRCCLTTIDRFTCWPEVMPIPDITAETVTKALIYFGCPSDIVTDRGRQFESVLFQYLAKAIGFHHRRIMAHPAYNGFVELFHRQLKASITCRGNQD